MRHVINAALLAAASLAHPAHAQDEEDIVVTATRTPTTATSLPARVEIIGRSDIEERNLVTLVDALGSEAVRAGGPLQQSSLFLRGANSKHALALYDGVPLNDASNPTGQYDFGQDMLGAIERVEVLRGPASAVHGSDAVGGVVNMIPRRGGAAAFEPFLELAAGAFDTRRILLGAAGGGELDYGLSAEALQTEGYDLIPDRMSTDTGDPDGARAHTFAASLRREAGPFAFDVLLRARDSRVEYDTFSIGRADDPDLASEQSQQLWRLGGAWRAGDALSLRLAGGEVRSDRQELDGGVALSSADSRRSFADLTAELRRGPLDATAGVSFQRDAIDTAPEFAAPLSVAEDRAAAFVVSQLRINDRLTITGSARLDDYERFGGHATYGIGIVREAASLRLFASYGTAFKAPSLSERFETSPFNLGNPDLEPEESSSWEIGADWIGRSWSVGASFYRTRIDQLISYDFLALQNVNIGEAEIDGAEIYVEAAPAPWAEIRLGYAWTDARDGAGARLLRRPEHAWRLDGRIHPTNRLSLSLSWAYVGERLDVTYDDAGAFASAAGVVGEYALGAAAASFDIDDGAEIFARIDNVTDETYEQPAAFAGSPRAAFIGLRARF